MIRTVSEREVDSLSLQHVDAVAPSTLQIDIVRSWHRFPDFSCTHYVAKKETLATSATKSVGLLICRAIEKACIDGIFACKTSVNSSLKESTADIGEKTTLHTAPFRW